MEDRKPTFKGKCYGCYKKEKNNWVEIVGVVSWSGVKMDNGKWFPGSYRFFCDDCCDVFNIDKNRVKRIVKIKNKKEATKDE